jgi:putative redox protein
MPSELSVHAVHEGEMRIRATAGAHAVIMDYPMRPDQQAAGLTPLQLLLASLAGCSGNALAILLRKAKQPVAGIEVRARGDRREQHPTVLTSIALEFLVRGAGVDPEAVALALRASEEKICPVWAMLKGGTPITASFRVVDEG